jgi:polyhydroxybutyrate depolymerase
LQKNLSGWNDTADRNGFIVVYPGAGNVFFRAFGTRDVPFITALIDRMQATYNIDRDRVYVNGLSNGGGMSYELSCVLSDRIAAVGAVGPAITMSPDLCPAAKPVPVVVFHGTADYFAKYAGGTSFVAVDPFPPIPLWIGNWARRNHCAPATREKRTADEILRIEYDNCAEPVVLYKIENGGHTWPGGAPLAEWFAGVTNRNISATEVMWTFFKEHPRRSR